MQVGQQPDSVAPCMRNEFKMSRFGHGGNLAQLENAFGKKSVRLENVVAAPIDQQLEFMHSMIVLTAGELDLGQALPQSGQIAVVMPWQWLFQPENTKVLELTSNRKGTLKPPALMSRQAGLDAGLVGIDHDVDPVADCGADRFHHFYIVAGIGTVKPQLHGTESLAKHALDVLDAL